MIKLLSFVMAMLVGVACASPATPTDLIPPLSSVSVSVEIDTPADEIGFGKPVTLRCVVNGLDVPYSIQWQYSEDRQTWIDIPCNEECYMFVLDESTMHLLYRVVIHC